jgi:hypothetical protein
VGNDEVGRGVGEGNHGQANAGGVGHGGLHVGVGCGVGVASGDCATGPDCVVLAGWLLRKSRTNPAPSAMSANRPNRLPAMLIIRFISFDSFLLTSVMSLSAPCSAAAQRRSSAAGV